LLIADLHSHTVFSDGGDRPEEVLEKARALRFSYLAITDHDQTHWLSDAGAELSRKARKMGISLLRGIELSTRDEKSGKKAHILGYWPTAKEEVCAPSVETLCEITEKRRTETTLLQASMIRNMGYDISDDEIRDVCTTTQLFKNDILKVLEKKGYISGNLSDFNRQFFGKSGSCYLEIEYVSTKAAVEAIYKDGGKAVLAHPGQQDNFCILSDLKPKGLWGIELHHPSHTIEHEKKVKEAAEKYSLYLTGGGDYHGKFAPSRIMGEYVLKGKEVEDLQKAGLLVD